MDTPDSAGIPAMTAWRGNGEGPVTIQATSPANAHCGVVAIKRLFQLDSGTSLFELTFQLIGFLFRGAFLDRGGRALNKLFGFF